MAMERIINGLRGTGDPLDAQLAIKKAVKEYRTGLHTPELVREYWQTLWREWGEKADLDIVVPACDRDQKKIDRLRGKDRRLVYVPQEVAGQETRHLLGKIFPKMGSYSVRKGNGVVNISGEGGWFDIEDSLSSPNTRTTEGQLRKLFDEAGTRGMRLNTYIIGSQVARLETGYFFDETTWSRLLGSQVEDRVVYARFAPDGFLYVSSYWLQHMGGRSEGVKRT